MRVERIELSPHPWQGRVLPLNDTRIGEQGILYTKDFKKQREKGLTLAVNYLLVKSTQGK